MGSDEAALLQVAPSRGGLLSKVSGDDDYASFERVQPDYHLGEVTHNYDYRKESDSDAHTNKDTSGKMHGRAEAYDHAYAKNEEGYYTYAKEHADNRRDQDSRKMHHRAYASAENKHGGDDGREAGGYRHALESIDYGTVEESDYAAGQTKNKYDYGGKRKAADYSYAPGKTSTYANHHDIDGRKSKSDRYENPGEDTSYRKTDYQEMHHADASANNKYGESDKTRGAGDYEHAKEESYFGMKKANKYADSQVYNKYDDYDGRGRLDDHSYAQGKGGTSADHHSDGWKRKSDRYKHAWGDGGYNGKSKASYYAHVKNNEDNLYDYHETYHHTHASAKNNYGKEPPKTYGDYGTGEPTEYAYGQVDSKYDDFDRQGKVEDYLYGPENYAQEQSGTYEASDYASVKLDKDKKTNHHRAYASAKNKHGDDEGKPETGEHEHAKPSTVYGTVEANTYARGQMTNSHGGYIRTRKVAEYSYAMGKEGTYADHDSVGGRERKPDTYENAKEDSGYYESSKANYHAHVNRKANNHYDYRENTHHAYARAKNKYVDDDWKRETGNYGHAKEASDYGTVEAYKYAYGQVKNKYDEYSRKTKTADYPYTQGNKGASDSYEHAQKDGGNHKKSKAKHYADNYASGNVDVSVKLDKDKRNGYYAEGNREGDYHGSSYDYVDTTAKDDCNNRYRSSGPGNSDYDKDDKDVDYTYSQDKKRNHGDYYGKGNSGKYEYNGKMDDDANSKEGEYYGEMKDYAHGKEGKYYGKPEDYGYAQQKQYEGEYYGKPDDYWYAQQKQYYSKVDDYEYAKGERYYDKKGDNALLQVAGLKRAAGDVYSKNHDTGVHAQNKDEHYGYHAEGNREGHYYGNSYDNAHSMAKDEYNDHSRSNEYGNGDNGKDVAYGYPQDNKHNHGDYYRKGKYGKYEYYGKMDDNANSKKEEYYGKKKDYAHGKGGEYYSKPEDDTHAQQKQYYGKVDDYAYAQGRKYHDEEDDHAIRQVADLKRAAGDVYSKNHDKGVHAQSKDQRDGYYAEGNREGDHRGTSYDYADTTAKDEYNNHYHSSEYRNIDYGYGKEVDYIYSQDNKRNHGDYYEKGKYAKYEYYGKMDDNANSKEGKYYFEMKDSAHAKEGEYYGKPEDYGYAQQKQYYNKVDDYAYAQEGKYYDKADDHVLLQVAGLKRAAGDVYSRIHDKGAHAQSQGEAEKDKHDGYYMEEDYEGDYYGESYSNAQSTPKEEDDSHYRESEYGHDDYGKAKNKYDNHYRESRYGHDEYYGTGKYGEYYGDNVDAREGKYYAR